MEQRAYGSILVTLFFVKKAYDLLSGDPWQSGNEPGCLKRLKEPSEQSIWMAWR